MSAYIPDRHEIWFLVKAAAHYARSPLGFEWWWDGKWHKEIRAPDEQIRVAQMLWDEAIHAVAVRYEDSEGPLPGPVDEDFIITADDLDFAWEEYNPVQVLKSCSYYEYQAVEDPEFRQTEAYAFIEALRREAIRQLPGYEESVWGAPEPTKMGHGVSPSNREK